MNTLHQLQQLIAEGNTEAAIKAFLQLVEAGELHNRRLHDDLLLLSNRFEDLKRKETLGLLDRDDAVREHALVNEALLHLIAEFESGSGDKPGANTITKNRRWIWLLAGLAAAASLVTFLLLRQSGPSSTGDETPALHIRPGMDTVWVEGGMYEMGSNRGEPDEFPHTVVVNSFYMDKSEVTNAQYATFLNAVGKHDTAWINFTMTYKQERCRVYLANGIYKVEEGYDQHPVINVSYAGATAFAAYYGMRLPTEAEWEYAARGGKSGKSKPHLYAGSDTASVVAWTLENAGGLLRPIRTKAPNGLGLYDLSGNVYEWCADYYNDRFYFQNLRENPMNSTPTRWRCVRGGNVFFNVEFSRVSNRGYLSPDMPNPGTGFRCVMDKKQTF